MVIVFMGSVITALPGLITRFIHHQTNWLVRLYLYSKPNFNLRLARVHSKPCWFDRRNQKSRLPSHVFLAVSSCRCQLDGEYSFVCLSHFFVFSAGLSHQVPGRQSRADRAELFPEFYPAVFSSPPSYRTHLLKRALKRAWGLLMGVCVCVCGAGTRMGPYQQSEEEELISKNPKVEQRGREDACVLINVLINV